jgi:hypothetical protein
VLRLGPGFVTSDPVHNIVTRVTTPAVSGIRRDRGYGRVIGLGRQSCCWNPRLPAWRRDWDLDPVTVEVTPVGRVGSHLGRLRVGGTKRKACWRRNRSREPGKAEENKEGLQYAGAFAELASRDACVSTEGIICM